jgi:hypothetical protein
MKTFDPNVVIAETVKRLAESVASKIWEESKGIVKGASLTLRVITASHKKYISRVTKDYYKSKSFLIQQTKTPLYDFYIPLGINRGETQYDQASIENLTFVENFNVITGIGGSGKSMMMRHLFLDTLVNIPKVPVMVELRDLNESKPAIWLTIPNLSDRSIYQKTSPK